VICDLLCVMYVYSIYTQKTQRIYLLCDHFLKSGPNKATSEAPETSVRGFNVPSLVKTFLFLSSIPKILPLSKTLILVEKPSNLVKIYLAISWCQTV
jgi:hypothetical protein